MTDTNSVRDHRDAVRALLEAPEDSLPLLTLHDEDEVVLGPTWSFGDISIAEKWAGRSEKQRKAQLAATLGRLARERLVLRGDDDRYRPGSALALVGTARAEAPVVVTAEIRIGAEDPWTAPRVRPFAYAIADERSGLRKVVLEIRSSGRHEYLLLTPAKAAAGLAAWAWNTLTSPGVEGAVVATALTFLRREAGDHAEIDRLILGGATGAVVGQLRRSSGDWALNEMTEATTLDAVVGVLESGVAASLAPRHGAEV